METRPHCHQFAENQQIHALHKIRVERCLVEYLMVQDLKAICKEELPGRLDPAAAPWYPQEPKPLAATKTSTHGLFEIPSFVVESWKRSLEHPVIPPTVFQHETVRVWGDGSVYNGEHFYTRTLGCAGIGQQGDVIFSHGWHDPLGCSFKAEMRALLYSLKIFGGPLHFYTDCQSIVGVWSFIEVSDPLPDNLAYREDWLVIKNLTDAHMSLLQTFGLLQPKSTVTAERPLRSRHLCQGLVIDDYFCVSTERRTVDPEDSRAHQCFQASQEAYSFASLGGSPHKDIPFATSGKVIGAQVNSSPDALTRGLVTIGSPAEKRLGIAYICFQVAKLSHTTDCLHLCLIGGLVSILGFRRPLLSILQESFRLVDTAAYDPNHPRVVPLSRAVACTTHVDRGLSPFVPRRFCH